MPKNTNINLSFFTESPDYYENGLFHSEISNDSFNRDRAQLLLPSCEELVSFKDYKVQDLVNIEIDLVARYLKNLIQQKC